MTEDRFWNYLESQRLASADEDDEEYGSLGDCTGCGEDARKEEGAARHPRTGAPYCASCYRKAVPSLTR